jgi:nucleolar protein 56
MSFFVLFESSAGYGLFSVLENEEIGTLNEEVQAGMTDFARFQRIVKMIAFSPFSTAENALENINAVSEHDVSPELSAFLEANMQKGKKGAKHPLGVIEPTLATAIQENLEITCRSDETIRELIRAIRVHFVKFVKPLADGNLEQSQLGLGHSYSRSKVKFNPGRADNMIIQSIALLDQLDKDLNTFAMRVREWYGWHFPELKQIVKDNYIYAKCAAFIKDKSTLTDDKLAGLEEIVGDEAEAAAILKAAKASMGFDTSDMDMMNIVIFTERMVSLATYRKELYSYLEQKMATVAPNLSSLIGETVAARLILKAGSLTSLAKCPASTIQILGAEKALFRALKTKGNTPKYGIIYHSSFIGRASAKNKGRISRYLANKCAIASRIDSFIEEPTSAYGKQLREQVEERLNFYDTGEAPRKNVDVMTAVAVNLREAAAAAGGAAPSTASKKKRKASDLAEEEVAVAEPEKKKKKKKESISPVEEVEEEPKKKSKKDKKEKKAAEEAMEVVEEVADESAKKKKKKKDKK